MPTRVDAANVDAANWLRTGRANSRYRKKELKLYVEALWQYPDCGYACLTLVGCSRRLQGTNKRGGISHMHHCMPWRTLIHWVAAIFAVATCVLAQAQASLSGSLPETVVLQDSQNSKDLNGAYAIWVEDGHNEDIQSVQSKVGKFHLSPPSAIIPLSGNRTLWIHLRFSRSEKSSMQSRIDIPLPFLDRASLFQTNALGEWEEQKAGSLLPKSKWTMAWLYPDFQLNVPAGTTRDVFLRIENVADQSIPIRISGAAQDHVNDLREPVIFGVVLGLLLCLSVLSGYRFLEFRNPSNAGAALLGLLITLTVAQINGIASAVLWPEFAAWSNIAFGVLPLLALGSFLLFLRHLYGLASRHPRFDLCMRLIGWVTILFPLGFAFLPLSLVNEWAGASMAAATVAAFSATVLYARTGSKIARWMLIALTPQFLLILWLSADQFGLVSTIWQIRYLTSFLLAITVTLLTYSLHAHYRDRDEILTRANLLTVQDALTGLLTREAFLELTKKAFQGVMQERQPAAIVLVTLPDYEGIRQNYSDRIAEQCILRAVVKLHRVMRDVDQAGRIGTCDFAILIDGVRSRDDLNARIVKLIASGLQPLPGLEPEIPLRFHAACIMLHENPLEPEIALLELVALAATIRPGTRRPFRYIDPVPTQAADLEGLI